MKEPVLLTLSNDEVIILNGMAALASGALSGQPGLVDKGIALFDATRAMVPRDVIMQFMVRIVELTPELPKVPNVEWEKLLSPTKGDTQLGLLTNAREVSWLATATILLVEELAGVKSESPLRAATLGNLRKSVSLPDLQSLAERLIEVGMGAVEA